MVMNLFTTALFQTLAPEKKDLIVSIISGKYLLKSYLHWFVLGLQLIKMWLHIACLESFELIKICSTVPQSLKYRDMSKFWLSIFETLHTTYKWNIEWQKCVGISSLWVLNEIIQKNILKMWKKLWKPFGSKLLNNTSPKNPAQFGWKWAGLAVLFSRQFLNVFRFFFHFNILIFIDFFEC
jgi:hypothetical protein